MQRFTFADVPSSVRSYRVTRLTPGEEYWFIVASVDARNQMYWPSSWIQKFAVTAAPTPTPCPTSHGPGAPTGGDGTMCPITGLPIGDGYLETGGISSWGEYDIRLDSATFPATIDFASGSRAAPAGRKWIRLALTAQNGRNRSVFFGPGTEYVLDTDTGNGFAWNSRYELEAGRSYTVTIIHDIPATATVAILAVQGDTGYTNSAYNQPDLFRIPIPAGSNTCATATGATLQALIAAGTCQAQAAGSDLCATASGSTLQSLIQAGVCPAQ